VAKKSLRALAQGQPCMVRIPGVCNGNPYTTVLAHLRLAGITGGAQKAPDALGAWACSECHRCIDSNGNSHGLERDFVRLAFYDGMARTQYLLLKDEYLLECVA